MRCHRSGEWRPEGGVKVRKAELEAAWDSQVVQLGTFIKGLVAGQGLGGLEGAVLQGITVKVGTADDPGVLCVVKCAVGPDKLVAFVGGRDIEQMLYTWRAKSRAQKMAWRADTPWVPR